VPICSNCADTGIKFYRKGKHALVKNCDKCQVLSLAAAVETVESLVNRLHSRGFKVKIARDSPIPKIIAAMTEVDRPMSLWHIQQLAALPLVGKRSNSNLWRLMRRLMSYGVVMQHGKAPGSDGHPKIAWVLTSYVE
jgi:hypothetical protein